MSARVGRNDPCPCGSGLKYKKCHALKEESPAANEFWNHWAKQIMVAIAIGSVGLLALAVATGVASRGTP